MPFSKKLSFLKYELPNQLEEGDHVYFCEPTGEAFMHYDDFCERVIQCNSLIWTDTVSGKGELTYLEALESEKRSSELLRSLPDKLYVPVLFLASIARRPTFDEMFEDVFSFVEDRYFIGEVVTFITLHDEIWREGVVTKVIAPSDEEIYDFKSTVQIMDSGEFFPPPSLYLYVVETDWGGKRHKNTVSIPLLKRPPGTWTKEKALAFLKHFTSSDEEQVFIERGVLQKFNIPNMTFNHFYEGDIPIFPVSKIMEDNAPLGSQGPGSNSKKNGTSKKPEKLVLKSPDRSQKEDKIHVKNGGRKTKDVDELSKPKPKLQQTDIKNYFFSYHAKGENKKKDDLISDKISDSGSNAFEVRLSTQQRNISQECESVLYEPMCVSDGPSCSGLSKTKESGSVDLLSKKRKQMRITGDCQIEGVKRSKNSSKSKSGQDSQAYLADKFKIEIGNEDKIRREQEVLEGFKLHEERLKMKAKNEEEKLQFAKFMKEWRKKREDLECEDLKPLPVATRVNCRIPNQLFGEFVLVLEFFNSFHEFLRVKSYIPGGINFDILERAVLETEIAGPLIDILCILLNAIFELQVEEHETPKTGIPISVDLNLEELYNRKMTFQEAIPLCVAASGWSNTFQGVSLNELHLNPTSISEVLRLHLLGSGGRAWDLNSKWLSQRGGHTNFDDPGLWLRVEQTSVLLHLSHQHVCQLSTEDKLTILSCLTNQILTYARVRDILDERGEKMRQAKSDVRALEIAELKLQKEAASKRLQLKREAKLLRLKGESLSQPNPQLLKHQKDAELEKSKMDKDISKLRADIQKKQSKVLPLVMKHQLHPIGCDRAHRNYWMFSSIPGLFVEATPFELGSCLPQPTPVRNEDRGDVETHVRKLFEEVQTTPGDSNSRSSSSDKENDGSDGEVTKLMSSPNKKLLSEQNLTLDKSNSNLDDKEVLSKELLESGVQQYEYLTCTSNVKCPVHCQLSQSHWSLYSNPEVVTLLLESLNERGVRESELKRFIIREQDRIKESISACPLPKLSTLRIEEQEPRKSTRNVVHYKSEVVNLNFPPGTPVNKIMETLLRESILDLENKITNGLLGVLKVDDRLAWRTAIENGSYDKQCDKLTWGFRRQTSDEKVYKDKALENQDQESDSISEEKSEVATEDSSQKLSDEEEEENETKEHGNNEEGEKSDEFIGKDIHKWGGTDGDVSSSIESNVISSSTGLVGFPVVHLAKLPNEATKQNVFVSEESSVESKILEESGLVRISNNKQNLDSDIDRVRKEVKGISHSTEATESSSSDMLCSPSRKDVVRNEPEDLASKDIVETAEVPPPRDPTIRDLACAILQIGQSVDPKNLMQPLAGDDSNNPRKQMKYWEVSLMNTINFSQLFIHQLTLDKSINWSKSILRMPCRICRRRCEPESMVTCVECDKRYHYLCTKPKVEEMPKGDWSCPFCTKESDFKASKPGRTSKRTRKSYTEEGDILQNNSPERKIMKLECKVCGVSDDTLVYCCSCSVAIHADCLDPPLKASRRQKENWLCYTCKPLMDFNSLDEVEVSSHYSESSRDYGSSREYSPERSVHREHSPIRRSSRRADGISDYLPLDNAVLQHLLDEMIHHKESWPFLRPVRKSEVPDYHLYIKKPMDLGTIKYKLNTAEYKNNYDFVADTLLVFENCFMYNSSQTAVYKCGTAMLQFFKARCKELGLVVTWNGT